MIRISEPDLGPEVEMIVTQVLTSGRLAQGPMVERFEVLCAEMAGAQHAVAVSSGTAALQAALQMSGIGPGDEVITSPLTFVATLNAILSVGATALFADIGNDFNIDPEAVANLVGPRTRAILPVHLYGLPSDMPRLKDLADSHDLLLVEDAAQAHGASVRGCPVGGWGLGAFSFYATKNVTAGEGGVVTTSDKEMADSLRLFRNQGMHDRYRYQTIGQNLRLSELQAAVAIPQLERLPAIRETRRRNAEMLGNLLSNTALVLPGEIPDRTHAWHQYTVLLPAGTSRDKVVHQLAERGIESGIFYPSLVWDHSPYRQHSNVLAGDTPFALDVSQRCLSLPIHGRLTTDQLSLIATAMQDSLEPV